MSKEILPHPSCMAPDGADPCAGYHALQAENAKLNKLYNHELSCGKTMRDLSNKQAEGIGELQAENIKLWHNLRDAMEWNWLDDDAPERFDLDIYHVQTRSAENE